MPQKHRQQRLSQVEIKMLFTNVTAEPFCFLNKLHLFNNFNLSAETCGATAILDYIYFPIPLKLYINGFNARLWSVYAGLKGLNGSTLLYLAWQHWLFRIGPGCVKVVHLGVIYTALVLSAWEWTLSPKLFLLQLFRCRIMRPRYDKRVSQSRVTVVEFPAIVMHLMSSPSLAVHSLSPLPASSSDSRYSCWWQRDNLLQMLRAPPEAYLISWILLYHSSPLA